MRQLKFLALLLLAIPQVAKPAVITWSSGKAKILSNTLSFNGGPDILRSTSNPTSIAVSAAAGSLLLNTSTGNVYRKTDAGLSTNWVLIGNPTLDNVTIEDSSGLRVKDAGISAAKLATDAVETAKIKDLNVTTGKLAANAVTRAKLESVGQQIASSGTSTFSTTSTSYTDVTNATISITTTGRPVYCILQSDGDTNVSNISAIGCTSDSTQCFGRFALLRDSTIVAQVFVKANGQSGAAAVENFVPPSSLAYLDTPAAGTYTYKVQAKTTGSGTVAAYVTRAKLACWEL